LRPAGDASALAQWKEPYVRWRRPWRAWGPLTHGTTPKARPTSE
jgi:hypothetical protein